MNETSMKLREQTIRSIAEILEIDAATVKGSDRLREDLGMDSLGSLELLSSLSSELKIDLEVEEAMDLRTVDDAVEFVARHVSPEAARATVGGV